MQPKAIDSTSQQQDSADEPGGNLVGPASSARFACLGARAEGAQDRVTRCIGRAHHFHVEWLVQIHRTTDDR